MTGTYGGQPAFPSGGQRSPSPAHVPPDQLRQLVREVLADVIGKMPARTASLAVPAVQPSSVPPSSVPHADPPGAGPSVPSGLASQPSAGGQAQSRQGRDGDRDEARMWTVRLSTDEDLHAFVLRVLKLAGNPKVRGDLISGRARFRLAGMSTTTASSTAAAATHQVEKGAVTERAVIAAAAAGARLVLGPRAVMTPLAKDKARALGVPIERPRGGLSDGRAPFNTERPRGGLSDGRAPVNTERPRGGLSDGRAPTNTDRGR